MAVSFVFGLLEFVSTVVGKSVGRFNSSSLIVNCMFDVVILLLGQS